MGGCEWEAPLHEKNLFSMIKEEVPRKSTGYSLGYVYEGLSENKREEPSCEHPPNRLGTQE